MVRASRCRSGTIRSALPDPVECSLLDEETALPGVAAIEHHENFGAHPHSTELNLSELSRSGGATLDIVEPIGDEIDLRDLRAGRLRDQDSAITSDVVLLGSAQAEQRRLRDADELLRPAGRKRRSGGDHCAIDTISFPEKKLAPVPRPVRRESTVDRNLPF